MKIREVVERILAYHPATPGYRGCDDYKCGDPEAECTGVVTALSPNISVIRKAIELNANLIVVHEPTFYTSEDGPGWFEPFGNSVYQEKRKLLDDHGIVVWRDHDHMHMNKPDSIFTGVLKYLGWLDKAEIDTDTGSYAHWIVHFEPCTLKELCRHLIDSIGMNGTRIIGDPDAVVSSAALVGHLYPSQYHKKDGSTGEYGVSIIDTLETRADVIIPGEVIDWTVLSYVRDAVELGKAKAMINLGHFNWEELGMKYMKDWLSELVGNELPVTYVPSGDMYNFILKEGE
ncbi:MAG: Nif3-like dinuclear metal center hexameric protein [Erysipelotrichaceae bacterium]|nr:Nif3-like dinuclear metal center hexameric protein [Erysipelotrichaceae bacterium]